jgi:ankyrin repeat protein
VLATQYRTDEEGWGLAVNDELIAAFKHKDRETVKAIVSSGFDLNSKLRGVTYLEYAWRHFGDYDFDIIKLLLEHGAQINDPSVPSITLASGRGAINELQYVLDLGADINAIDHVGTSALSSAAYEGHVEEAKFLLRSGLDLERHGGKALQIAARRGQMEMVRLLVEEGANINYQVFHEHADKSATPLHNAALFGHLPIVKYLLEHGADPTLKDYYGDRAFSNAKRQKYTEIMKLIAAYEPKELYDLDKKRVELKKMGLPMAIIRALGEERKRVELPDSKYIDFIEYGSIMDVTIMEIEEIRLINLLFDADQYDALGFLVWIPAQKALGSYDVEHQNLLVLHDANWSKFTKTPSFYIDRILDGEYDAP